MKIKLNKDEEVVFRDQLKNNENEILEIKEFVKSFQEQVMLFEEKEKSQKRVLEIQKVEFSLVGEVKIHFP